MAPAEFEEICRTSYLALRLSPSGDKSKTFMYGLAKTIKNLNFVQTFDIDPQDIPSMCHKVYFLKDLCIAFLKNADFLPEVYQFYMKFSNTI